MTDRIHLTEDQAQQMVGKTIEQVLLTVDNTIRTVVDGAGSHTDEASLKHTTVIVFSDGTRIEL